VAEIAAAKSLAFALLAISDHNGISVIFKNYRAILALWDTELTASPVGCFGNNDHSIVGLGVFKEEYVARDRLLKSLIEIVMLDLLGKRVDVVGEGVELYCAHSPVLADELEENFLAIVADTHYGDILPHIEGNTASVLACSVYSVKGNGTAPRSEH
jgi:hypothetical protein